MQTKKRMSTHSLFIEWGKFKAGAFGIPAVVTLGLLTLTVAAVLLWK